MTVAEASPVLRTLLEQGAERHRTGDIDGAAAFYERILKADPDHADALNLAAMVAYQRGYMTVALELVNRSLAVRPNYGPAHGNLGLILTARGQRTAALAELRRAAYLDPTAKEVRDNLCFALDSDPLSTREDGRRARDEYDRDLVQPLLRQAEPHTNDRTSGRRIRVGYVSADFQQHSAANASWPIIEHHDRDQFEVHLFSDVLKPDAQTARFMEHADVYHSVRALSDEQLAQSIRDAEIDVLVDLGGFAKGNRTLVFARKPSPVQVLAWGYVADCHTLSCYDAVFADQVTVPDGAEANVPVVRMPAFMPYQPTSAMPEVSPPPAAKNEYLTFGYLGRPHKLDDGTLAVWASILHRVPDSRLLLKAAQLDDEAYGFAIVDGLVARGINDERIEIRGGTTPYAHAATYAEVDIALDTPQNGGMTTLESLYMGVPVITLPGDTITRRTSASILTSVGQTGGIAHDTSSYIKLAEKVAQYAEYQQREQARELMQASLLMQYEAYTRAAESAYRELFEGWCGQ